VVADWICENETGCGNIFMAAFPFRKGKAASVLTFRNPYFLVYKSVFGQTHTEEWPFKLNYFISTRMMVQAIVYVTSSKIIFWRNVALCTKLAHCPAN
jgi:hypothetical protein